MSAPDYEEDINDRDPEIMLAKAEIAQTREAVASKVMALQRELARAVDWRAWVAKRPVEAVVLALGVGVLLGLVRVSVGPREE